MGPAEPEQRTRIWTSVEEALARQDVRGAEKILRELEPDEQEPWRLKLFRARILSAKGRIFQAIRSLRSLPAAQRQQAEVQLELGRLSFAQGQLSEARTALQTFLKQRPEATEGWLLLAEIHRRGGAWGAASNACSRAIALDPQCIEGYLKLGQVLLEGRQFRRAVQVYQAGLKLVPGSAELLCDLGAALLAVGDVVEAISQLQRSLAIRPLNLPAVYNLGSAFMETGRFDEAERRFEQVLRLRPDHPDAWFKRMTCRRQTPADRPALLRLRQYSRKAGNGDQARLLFALGKGHDDLGDYEQAWSSFRQANELRAAVVPSDEAAFEAQVQSTIEALNGDLLARLKQPSDPGHRLLFLVGLPRSGSTLLSQVLAAHPDMTPIGEHGRAGWIKMAMAQPFGGRIQYPEMLPLLSPLDLTRLAADFVKDLPDDGRWLVDKTLSHYMDIGLLHLLFPRARFVHVQRDPRDACLSMFFSDFSAGHGYSYRLAHLARRAASCNAMLAHWQQTLPHRLLSVRYETLVDSFEETIAGLLGALQLPPHPDPHAYRNQDNAVNTASSWQVRQPVYSHSVGRWRQYRTHLGTLLDALNHDPTDSAPPD